MFVMRGYKNNLKMGILEREFRELGQEQGYFAHVSLLRYIKVSYRNSLDEADTKYFIVKPIRGSEQIAKDIGEREFQDHSSKLGSRYFAEFGSLNAQTLLDLALKSSD